MSESKAKADDAAVAVNYKVHGPSLFGDNPRGTVLPRWVAELSGSTAEELVANGTLTETDEPVVKNFRAPEPKTDIDPAPAMSEELTRLRRENAKLAADNKGLVAHNDALKVEKESHVRGLGEQTAQVTHWRGVAEKHAKRVEDLEAELFLANETKPKAEEPAPAKKK